MHFSVDDDVDKPFSDLFCRLVVVVSDSYRRLLFPEVEDVDEEEGIEDVYWVVFVDINQNCEVRDTIYLRGYLIGYIL